MGFKVTSPYLWIVEPSPRLSVVQPVPHTQETANSARDIRTSRAHAVLTLWMSSRSSVIRSSYLRPILRWPTTLA
jgi:hypothetical protein